MVEYMCGVQQDRNLEMTSSLFGLAKLPSICAKRGGQAALLP